MRVQKTVQIACTPSQLWPFLTEPALIKRWIEDLVDDTPDDPARTTGVGVTSTMRLREGGKIQSYRCVMTAWEHERRLALQLTGGSFAPGMAMDVEYRIAPDAGGTRLDYDVQVPMKGVFRLMAPLIWLVSRGNARKTLGKLAEIAAAPPPKT
jgi:carbon monoxide dehydrogenase subunit G